jgi:hypothetical protein
MIKPWILQTFRLVVYDKYPSAFRTCIADFLKDNMFADHSPGSWLQSHRRLVPMCEPGTCLQHSSMHACQLYDGRFSRDSESSSGALQPTA